MAPIVAMLGDRLDAAERSSRATVAPVRAVETLAGSPR